MSRFRATLAGIALALTIAIPMLNQVGAQTGTPTTVPPAVTSQVFAEASPVVVTDPELAIAVVRVEPGAAIAPHVHPGTQIGAIAAGELTYSVLTGQVMIRRGGEAAASPATPVRAGETVVLVAGDAVIENPGAAHQARNDGDETVVIWLSTMFPAGAPRSAAVAATPGP
ncbi:MAG: hypothetical protein H0U10_13530 [Chloroflexia bacterium]|nr:hypothetical protein [Chloroflexia bacterium]